MASWKPPFGQIRPIDDFPSFRRGRESAYLREHLPEAFRRAIAEFNSADMELYHQGEQMGAWNPFSNIWGSPKLGIPQAPSHPCWEGFPLKAVDFGYFGYPIYGTPHIPNNCLTSGFFLALRSYNCPLRLLQLVASHNWGGPTG